MGLKIRILREQGENKEADDLSNLIDQQLLMPTKLIQDPEKMSRREEKRRLRFTYDDCIRKDKIDQYLLQKDTRSANEIKFIALLGMIGDTETGLYPNLSQSKEQIEEKTKEYIEDLSKLP